MFFIDINSYVFRAGLLNSFARLHAGLMHIL